MGYLSAAYKRSSEFHSKYGQEASSAKEVQVSESDKQGDGWVITKADKYIIRAARILTQEILTALSLTTSVDLESIIGDAISNSAVVEFEVDCLSVRFQRTCKFTYQLDIEFSYNGREKSFKNAKVMWNASYEHFPLTLWLENRDKVLREVEEWSNGEVSVENMDWAFGKAQYFEPNQPIAGVEFTVREDFSSIRFVDGDKVLDVSILPIKF